MELRKTRFYCANRRMDGFAGIKPHVSRWWRKPLKLHIITHELRDRKFYFWRNVNLKISCTLLIQYSLLFLFWSLWSDEQNAPVRYARLILWRTLTSRISEGSTLKSIMDVVIKMSRYLVNVFRASTCTIYVLSLIIRRTVFNKTIYG